MPFISKKNYNEFGRSILNYAMRIQENNLKNYLSSDNQLVLFHGQGWSSYRDEKINSSNLRPATATIEVNWETILSYDVGEMVKVVNDFAEEFSNKIIKGIYETISDSCEENGNVVAGNGLSEAEQFYKLMEKVEFSVDENGRVQLPSIHLHPDSKVKLEKSIIEAGPEFESRVEKLKLAKSEQAIKKEKERLSRFKGVDF